MLNFINTIFHYLTSLAFICCFTATMINILKCVLKYITIDKKIKKFKNGKVSESDLDTLTHDEYILWIHKFLYLFDFTDSKYNLSTCSKRPLDNCIIKSKQDLPIIVDIHFPDESNITLSYLRQFLGKLKINNCKMGIMVIPYNLPSNCSDFISTIPLDYKITILSTKKIVNLHNSVCDFPTLIA